MLDSWYALGATHQARVKEKNRWSHCSQKAELLDENGIKRWAIFCVAP